MGAEKRKMVVVAFAAILVLLGITATQVAFAQAQPKEVKIGVVIPFTGTAAKTGENIKQALDFAVDQVNSSGGIKSMGGSKLRLMFADHTGKPEVAISEAERLVTMEKVDALMGSFMSGVTLAATEVAERYKIPWVVIIAASDEITERGFKYVFRPTDITSVKNKANINAIIDIGRKTGYPVKTMGIIYEHTDWGQTVANGMKPLLPQAGIKLVLEEPFPHGLTDFTPMVLKAKAANPDVIIPVMYFQDAVLFTKTLAQMKWYPMGITTGGGGFTEPSYIQQLGKNEARYVATMSFFHVDVLERMPWAKATNARFKAKYGTDFSEPSAMAYCSIYTLVDALERAGSKDPQKLRDALASTDITTGPAMLVGMERIKISPDGQNHYSSALVMQIGEDGNYHVVWPERLVIPGIKWIWPDRRWKK